MQPVISVIVPIYNVEKYLARCLDSLCRQSFTNIEILLIDDASSDRSGEICEHYAAQDKRFKVFHHAENKGPSAARNTGLRHAVSDFLMFADSDDWVNEDFCKAAYECAIHNRADLVMFGYQYISEQTIHSKQKNLYNTVAEGFRTHEEALNLSLTGFGMVPVNKLYRKSLFENIFFPEGQLYEDTAICYKIIWKAARIYCMNTILYYRFLRPGSITMSKPARKMVRDRFKVCRQQYNDLLDWGFYSEQLDGFIIYTSLTYCIQTPIDFSDSYYIIAADTLRNTKKAPPDFSWRRRFLLMLFRRSPNLFNLVCKLWNKQVN